MHAASETELLERLRRFFEICREFGLKLHAEKTHLFLREANFCGRIIDSKGVRHDPRSLDTLKNMRTPEVAGDLQQFLCATGWMRSSIPEYAKTIAPLHNLMEDCYTRAGKRTKRAVRKTTLHGLWGAAHSSAFSQIKAQLSRALTLAHPKEGHTTCLFSDASDTHWPLCLHKSQPIQLEGLWKNKLTSHLLSSPAHLREVPTDGASLKRKLSQ